MPETLDLRSARALTLGSGCKIAFIKKKNSGVITPVLMLMGSEAFGEHNEQFKNKDGQGTIGVITIKQQKDSNGQINFNTVFEGNALTVNPINNQSSDGEEIVPDWIELDPTQDEIVYPRIFIRSLGLKTDSSQLTLKYQQADTEGRVNYSPLQQYEDYSVLTRSVDNEYVLTLNSENFLREMASADTGLFEEKRLLINYTISNADTSIYLDALEVAKENSEPQVSYEVTPEAFQSQALNDIYNKMGYLVRINDSDLKFENVRGYISSFTLKLDAPDEDTIEIKNYKTKFEDLFSTITAQTEAMKKNSRVIENAASVFTNTGEISEEVMQSTIRKVDLDYAFDNGKLTIDEHNGIWGTSDSGVVAFRGGGIFTATERNAQGNWRWNTGITPEGINADLITSGQLDTNLIKIYAGNHLRFQMNGDGIFAYKSTIDDAYINDDGELKHPLEDDPSMAQKPIQTIESLDGKQYVRFNDEGLALIAKKGAKVLSTDKRKYITVLDDQEVMTEHPNLLGLQEIKRVEVSWEGFVMRNWQNEKVFYAEPQTGNLMLMGTIHASGGTLGAWNFNGAKLWADAEVNDKNEYTSFVALNAGSEEELFKGDGTPYTDAHNVPLSLHDGNTNAYAFWAGTPDPYKAPFSIQKNGYLRASSGVVGGWSLSSQALYCDTMVFSTVGKSSTDKVDWNTFSQYDDEGNRITPTQQTQKSLTDYYIWISQSNASSVGVNNSCFAINKSGEIFSKELYLIKGTTVGGGIKYTLTTALETLQKDIGRCLAGISSINGILNGSDGLIAKVQANTKAIGELRTAIDNLKDKK